MKISILTPDLSQNCLGRAWLLAKILQRHYEVEIVGPIFGKGIWEPLAQLKDIPYKFIEVKGIVKPYWQFKKLMEKISGDVIYAHKPFFTSFGIGLLKRWVSRKPLILDIDDWERGFIKEEYKNHSFIQRFKDLAYSTFWPYRTGSFWNNLLSEKMVRFADEITVSNSFLKEKFGGTIIPHGRDTEAFNPEKFDKNQLRERCGIKGNRKVVMFFGSPAPYKGIEDLIDAISLLQDRDIMLVLVGIDKDSYSQSLIMLSNDKISGRFRAFGLQPFKKVPEFLALSDIVVIPQKRNFATVGQLPAKVFDAMAMAKPIIATNVSDLPEILEHCGWIVEPDSPEQLAETIRYILDNPEDAEEISKKARQKCIDKYSWDAMEKILVGIFKKYN